MSWIALLAALGSGVFAWWRTRELSAFPKTETEADRGEVEPSRYDVVQRRLEEALVAIDHLEQAEIRMADRLDALEAREVPDVSRLKERVESYEVKLHHFADAVESISVRATAWRETVALLASYDPTFWEAIEEPDDSEGGAVIYHVPEEWMFADVLTEFGMRFHDIGSHPSLRLIGVCTEPGVELPDEIAGARKIATRHRVNRTRVGSNYWVGDDTDWRNGEAA